MGGFIIDLFRILILFPFMLIYGLDKLLQPPRKTFKEYEKEIDEKIKYDIKYQEYVKENELVIVHEDYVKFPVPHQMNVALQYYFHMAWIDKYIYGIEFCKEIRNHFKNIFQQMKKDVCAECKQNKEMMKIYFHELPPCFGKTRDSYDERFEFNSYYKFNKKCDPNCHKLCIKYFKNICKCLICNDCLSKWKSNKCKKCNEHTCHKKENGCFPDIFFGYFFNLYEENIYDKHLTKYQRFKNFLNDNDSDSLIYILLYIILCIFDKSFFYKRSIRETLRTYPKSQDVIDIRF